MDGSSKYYYYVLCICEEFHMYILLNYPKSLVAGIVITFYIKLFDLSLGFFISIYFEGKMKP